MSRSSTGPDRVRERPLRRRRLAKMLRRTTTRPLVLLLQHGDKPTRAPQPGRAQSTGSAPRPVEQLVGARERSGAEEAAARRQRGRMRRLDDRRRSEQRPQVRGIPPPQDGDERRIARGERADGVLGDLLPSPSAVRRGKAGRDGQHAVQQHDALIAPARQVAMDGGRDAEIGVELLVDVREAARQRAHVPLDRERQADRMPRRRVRVLTDDEHLDVRERALERAQDAVAGGQVVPPRRDLSTQALAERGDVGGDGREGLRPAGVDEPGLRQFGKRQRHRVRPTAPRRPCPPRGPIPERPGEVDPQRRGLPGVVGLHDRRRLRVDHGGPDVGTAVDEQLDREVERAPAVGDVIDEQHPAPVEVGHVQLGRKHLGRIEHRADARVELDVDRAAVLDAEPVGDRARRQQSAPGDRDDDLGDESVGEDRPGEVSGCFAEAVPGQLFALRHVGLLQSIPRARRGPRASRCCADCATGRIVTRSRLMCPGAFSA